MGCTATRPHGYTNECCIAIGASQIHIIIYDFIHCTDVFFVCIEYFQLWKHWVEHNAATDTLNILLQHRIFFNGFSLTNEWKIKINCICSSLTLHCWEIHRYMFPIFQRPSFSLFSFLFVFWNDRTGNRKKSIRYGLSNCRWIWNIEHLTSYAINTPFSQAFFARLLSLVRAKTSENRLMWHILRYQPSHIIIFACEHDKVIRFGDSFRSGTKNGFVMHSSSIDKAFIKTWMNQPSKMFFFHGGKRFE